MGEDVPPEGGDFCGDVGVGVALFVVVAGFLGGVAFLELTNKANS